MELVYLWVEDYKNIKKQGFNFSPRFTCDYDEDSNELTINKNDDYIENFFGDNINVTAIVGKNGSGKSSVFEVLTFLYWQGLIKNKDDKTFFLYKVGDKFLFQCENYKIYHECSFKEFITINNNTKINAPTAFSARAQMPLIHFSNCISDMTHNRLLNPLKSYDKFYNGVQPDKPMMQSKYMYDNFNQKFQYILQKNKDFFSFIDEGFIFDNYNFELHIYELGAWVAGDELYKNILSLDESIDTLFKDVTMENHEMYFYRFMALYIISKSEGVITYDDIEQKSREDKDDYSKKYIFNKVEPIFKEKDFSAKKYDEVLDICLKALDPSFERLEHDIRQSFKREDFNSEKVKKLLEKYKYHESDIWKSDIFLIEKQEIGDMLSTPLEFDLLNAKILRCNFVNKQTPEYSFLNLSSGEKLYLNFITNFAYTIYRLEEDYKGVILFDEIELSFHPEWQKKILSHLLYMYTEVLKSKKLNLHLLLTSHSPFLLSDIPKQNIIFLDTDEKGNCTVVNGLKEKKQTFGSNIHTLLSDSFFMEDGLIGEFAKSKINEIIDFHREVEKENNNKIALKSEYEEKRTKFWQTQSIVGEAYLKQVLENHLVEIEKILLGKDGAKASKRDRLLTELKDLEND